MIRCLSYRNIMSDKVYKKSYRSFSSYNNVQYCFQSVEIKESGGSFSVITSTSLNPLAIKSTAKIKKNGYFCSVYCF